MVAALNDHPGSKWIPSNYDRRTYRMTRRRVVLNDTERVMLDVIEDLTIHAEYFTPYICRSGKVLATLAGRPISSVERAMTTLKKRGIILAEKGLRHPSHNDPDTIGINPDFAEWDTIPSTMSASCVASSFVMPSTMSASKVEDMYKSLNPPKREDFKSSISSARAHEASEVSPTPEQEQSEDSAIVAALAASVEPEPIRYRPLPKQEQTRRNTASPGDAPEVAFVAWREGFTTRYTHDPPRMSDDLRRLLLDLAREYPAVIDKVVRGYFVWTKLDEGKIRAKGLKETLEAECAACMGNPNRTPFPPDAPIPKRSFSAPPQRLTRLDPMDAYKKKRMPPTRALEVSP